MKYSVVALYLIAAAACAKNTSRAARPPLGVYEGPGANGAAQLPAFTQWFGRAPDRALDFFANDTWASLESDAAWTCYSWCPAAGSAVVPAMTFSVPLTVDGTSLADVASGMHDSSFLAVAKSLVTYSWGGATLRLGWEFNGSWMPWAAGQDPVNYVAAYRRVVALMRSVPGANFTFDWCCSWGPNQTAPDSVYPGDDVVDIIGMDVYNVYYSSADADPQARWNNFLTAQYGLNWLASFSLSHGKAISIPEWGTGEWLVDDGGIGGGDDPLFVTNMSNYIKTNNAAYSDYWDFHDSTYDALVSNGEHPNAGAALKTEFGAPILFGAPIAFDAPIVPPGQIPWIGLGDSPTATSVSVSFVAPYGGGAVGDYVIQYRITGASAWSVYGTVTGVGWQTLSGLAPGTSYDVCVYAANAGGNGPSSATFTLSTLTLAAAAAVPPGQIPWIGLGDGSTPTTVSINFAPPNDGGTPSAYVIQYRVTGRSTWTNYGTVTWTGWQTLGGLTPGTSYDTQVYAINPGGSGLPSAVFTMATTSN